MNKVYFIAEECGNSMSGPDDRRIGLLYNDAQSAYDNLLKDYVLVKDDIYKSADKNNEEMYRITARQIDRINNDGWHTPNYGYCDIIEIKSITSYNRKWTYYLKEEKVY